jgi:hypothetical protein
MRHNLGRLLRLLLMAVIYLPLNRRAHDRVLKTPVDERIPLVPILAVPYLAFLPIYWSTVLDAFRRDRDFAQLADTATLVYGISNLTYLLFQTHMPRPQSIPDAPGAGLLRYVYSHDEPYCDFPSEHSSSAVMFALHLHATNSPLRTPGTALSATVLAATLMLKQHTVAGTLGGTLLALPAWAVVRRSG